MSNRSTLETLSRSERQHWTRLFSESVPAAEDDSSASRLRLQHHRRLHEIQSSVTLLSTQTPRRTSVHGLLGLTQLLDEEALITTLLRRHTERERQMDRQTDRQTDRHTHTHRETERDTERERDRWADRKKDGRTERHTHTHTHR